jgi:Flp pilus assembly protein CpaB
LRLLQRLAICGLIGLAAPFGVLALLNAQAKLDHQLELFVQGADNAPLQMLWPSPSPNMSTEMSAPNEPAPVHAEEPAHVDRFSPPILSPAIDIIPAEGKKAVVVRVSNGLNAIDFARPDRWVDVLLTRQLETNSIFSDVIVQNARILAVDADPERGARSVARSVTLEVDLIDAQKLLLATQVGFLSVVLSRQGDRPQDVRQVDIDDLTTTAGTAETHTEATAATTPAAPAAPPPPVAATPEAASAPEAMPAPEAPPTSPDVASTPATPPAPEAAAPPAVAAVAAETIEPAREEDDARFGWVTVRRPGAAPLVHRVPRE